MTITIITATLNAEATIAELIKSLSEQTDKDYCWLVQDGFSTDRTLDIIRNSNIENISIESKKDFGIYDALNSAVKRCKTDYYLVIGSDDKLNPSAIENYKKSILKNNSDFVAAAVDSGSRRITPSTNKGWLFGMCGVASSHSVGLLIRTAAHQKYGYYSHRFPIVADQLFVKSALNKGASINRESFLAGFYNDNGFSGQSILQFHFEFAVMQILTEKHKFIQFLIFLLRIFKNWKLIFKS